MGRQKRGLVKNERKAESFLHGRGEWGGEMYGRVNFHKCPRLLISTVANVKLVRGHVKVALTSCSFFRGGRNTNVATHQGSKVRK